MKRILYLLFTIISINLSAQNLSEIDNSIKESVTPDFLLNKSLIRSTNPPSVPVRTPAQFEEMQGVTITWKYYTTDDLPLLAEIVDRAQESVDVYIACTDSNTVKTYLQNAGTSLNRVKYVIADGNSIWARDYGLNNIYENEVNNYSITDWKYNRNRPKDDTIARRIAAKLNVPIYETTTSPNKLVHTGGNFMCDGHGTAFSSKLVLDENATGGGWNNNLTEADVDSIMKKFMGIKRYIKMETLPYDGIHHIDMHMKLLDEETILVGEYPSGVADGPQIEDNIDYVISNFQSCYDRPYKIIRIPQPPMQNGTWPSNGGDYLTYCNAIILNNIVLVPKYYTQYDTTALRIWKESMPGYKIYQLDCNNIIQYSGAIHCITHEIAVNDPIYISHAKLLDTYNSTTPYEVDAYVNTSSGVSSVNMFWTLDTLTGYASIAMADMGDGNYQAFIPAQPEGTKIFYYLEASSNSGRTVRKPLVAPTGVNMFKVLSLPNSVSLNNSMSELFTPYPVPASDNINITFNLKINTSTQIIITDMMGRTISYTYFNNLNAGIHQYQFDVRNLATGNYFIQLRSGNSTNIKKFIVE